jgi:hypothetical protein
VNVTDLRRPEGWPVLSDAALRGLPGEVVQTLLPHTEADPAALLLTFLVGFGNAVGPGPYVVADGARHPANEFAVLVGDTSRARKGTSLAQVLPILAEADLGWTGCRVSGLASGEGVMQRLADEDADPRLFVVESEFARLLTVGNREGSILSAVIRDAWDGVPLQHVTRHDPLKVDRHHVSVVAHVTEDELQVRLTRTDAANGFANRFLFALVTRSKLLPHGGDLDPFAHRRLGVATGKVLKVARGFGRLRRTPEANDLWERLYAALSIAPSGVAGQLTARAEAHLLRLSLLYALTDGCEAIDVQHLEAAWELYRYCHQSTVVLAGASQLDVEQRLLDALRNAGDAGMTGTEQRDLFNRHVKGVRLHQARQRLEAAGLAVTSEVPTDGRPQLLTCATRDRSDLGDLTDLPSLSSLRSQGVLGGAA